MANIERDAFALVHVVALVSAVGMLLEPEVACWTSIGAFKELLKLFSLPVGLTSDLLVDLIRRIKL